MITQRIIGTILVKEGWAVQSRGFSEFRPLGKPEVIASYLDSWGIDEILLIDISAPRAGACITAQLVETVAEKILSPLTVAGGISSLADVRRLMSAGADKVAICSAIEAQPELISEIAEKYGSQALVAGIDVVKDSQEEYGCYVSALSQRLSGKLLDRVSRYEKLGAGELLIHAADRDGAGVGFDLPLLNQLAGHVSIPVIAAGGYGKPQHLIELFSETGVDAAALGNALSHCEHSVLLVKSALKRAGISVRMDLATNYESSELDLLGRLLKKSDESLTNLRFKVLVPEVI